jgi:hypothetical protein
MRLTHIILHVVVYALHSYVTLAQFYGDEVNKVFYDVRLVGDPVLDAEQTRFVSDGANEVRACAYAWTLGCTLVAAGHRRERCNKEDCAIEQCRASWHAHD